MTVIDTLADIHTCLVDGVRNPFELRRMEVPDEPTVSCSRVASVARLGS